MSDPTVITPDWAGLHVLDILRHHLSPSLVFKYRDSLACRLVCRAWRNVFYPRLVCLTPELFLNRSDAMEDIIRSSKTINYGEAEAPILDWLVQMAQRNLKTSVLRLKFQELSPEAASSFSKLLRAKLPHLRELDLEFAEEPRQDLFRLIADAIGDTPNSLESLELAWPYDTDGGADALFVALGRNSTLRKLRLDECYLRSQSQEKLIELLQGNRNLTHLWLGLSAYPAGDPKYFSDRVFCALEKNTTLEVLNISSRDPSAAAFEVFRHNNTLEKLHLDWGSLDAADLPVIFSALEQNRGIKNLSLSFSSATEDAPGALREFFATNSIVQKLVLKIRGHVELHYGPMFQGLTSNTSLTRLDVSELAPGFCEQLAEFIEKRASDCPLRYLGIQYSRIEMYAPRLVKALALLPRLETLNFIVAHSGPDSAAPLAELVEKSTSLKNLRLYKSSLGDPGMIRLCTAVAQSFTIQHLAIGGGAHQLPVFTAVCNMIARCTSLQVLDFAGARIPGEYRPMFEEVVRSSPLVSCHLTFGNEVSEEGIELVQELQKRG
eukprot:TRINITY_DN8025_c0_g1_i1.p1 TRINITY_DN8025_c0_g1~~TRINITY_DN8025_c0_g1_i1.p1  ORF type:complete len:550 (-),score=70.54 TRINITY_DN8025_c0_g1_i1:808-2457(-)